MAVATINYVQFKTRADFSDVWPRWQNFFVDRPSDFMPFGYGQGAGQVAGDRSEATLVMPVNQISLNYIHEAARDKHLLEITTKEINVLSMQESTLISREIFTIGSYSHDQSLLNVRLRGPGNAVSRGPTRYLSEKLVGSIPSSGTLLIG